MISDILFQVETTLEDAEKEIGVYLEDDATKGCYQDRAVLAEIVDVLGRVRALRVKLDNPMGFEPANP